nr:MAG TPA: adenine-specific methyltransferase [Caudoviricetes sp.]
METPIKAGCSEEGIVLDQFMGSGPTAVVALRLGRNTSVPSLMWSMRKYAVND